MQVVLQRSAQLSSSLESPFDLSGRFLIVLVRVPEFPCLDIDARPVSSYLSSPRTSTAPSTDCAVSL